MGTFIAVDFDELREYFSHLQKQMPVKNAKLSLTKSFHLTLKFLGEVPEDKIRDIKEKLSKIKISPFSIRTGNIGFFPNENYARVVWVGLEPIGSIAELQKQIDNELLPIFPREKNFHPHITLARVNFINDKKDFLNKINSIKTEIKEKSVKNFVFV